MIQRYFREELPQLEMARRSTQGHHVCENRGRWSRHPRGGPELYRCTDDLPYSSVFFTVFFTVFFIVFFIVFFTVFFTDLERSIYSTSFIFIEFLVLQKQEAQLQYFCKTCKQYGPQWMAAICMDSHPRSAASNLQILLRFHLVNWELATAVRLARTRSLWRPRLLQFRSIPQPKGFLGSQVTSQVFSSRFCLNISTQLLCNLRRFVRNFAADLAAR